LITFTEGVFVIVTLPEIVLVPSRVTGTGLADVFTTFTSFGCSARAFAAPRLRPMAHTATHARERMIHDSRIIYTDGRPHLGKNNRSCATQGDGGSGNGE
jgi:hypothetical protein